MEISTDNPKECHNFMYAALENYKQRHKGPFFPVFESPFASDNNYTFSFRCKHCKAMLIVTYSLDNLIKRFTFNKSFCDSKDK